MLLAQPKNSATRYLSKDCGSQRQKKRFRECSVFITPANLGGSCSSKVSPRAARTRQHPTEPTLASCRVFWRFFSWSVASRTCMHHRAPLTARPNTCGRLSMSGRERKRTRSWEVDVSLEELVSWDVLDQFMGDMPSEPVQPEQSSSSSDALGLSRGLGSTQMPLSPALHGSQLPLMAPACGGSSSRYGLDAPAHQPAHANAATLAQSFMSEWQQGVPWQGALPGVVRVRVRC